MKHSNSGSRTVKHQDRRPVISQHSRKPSGKKKGGVQGRKATDKRVKNRHSWHASPKVKGWQREMRIHNPKRFKAKCRGGR